jgi:hypothetical protein
MRPPRRHRRSFDGLENYLHRHARRRGPWGGGHPRGSGAWPLDVDDRDKPTAVRFDPEMAAIENNLVMCGRPRYRKVFLW